MNGLDGIKRVFTISAVCALLSGLLAPMVVVADVMEISAEFVPDPSNPGFNSFKNTTPPSGFCAIQPFWCNVNKVFSIQSNITAESKDPILANHSLRQGPMFQIPAQWRDLEVFHEDGIESAIVQFRVVSIGGNYLLSPSVRELIGRPEVTFSKAHGLLWGGTETNYTSGQWYYAPRPCTAAINVNYYESTWGSFYWNVPEGQTCGKTAAFDISSFAYSKLDFMYELVTPSPLKMKAGIYTGRVRYGVGPMMDLDLGDVMVPSDSELVFNFTLKVDHIFKVEIPPGGNTVVLLPQGGWQAWLNQGRKPTRLFRDQTFNIWTSTPFKMSLECEHYAANSTCALQDDKNNQVPVDVSVSLPSGLSDAERQSVSRRRLRVDGVGTENFEPALYVDRKPGTLHFEVSKGAVEAMLARDSRHYSGDITVIWDSEV
jgi:hypothetical protein